MLALEPGSLAGRRIVFLNWRDFAHPQAGGAELFTHSVAERFAAAGAEVILLTSRPRGLAREEEVRGVRVHRRGGTLGVYPAALLWLLRHRRRIDAIVDCQNGIPFFSPLVVSRRTAVVCLVHHVHQEQFRRHFPWPLSEIGRMLEGPVSRRIYGRLPLAAVSPSTRTDVRRKLRLRGPLHVVPNGMDVPAARATSHVRSATPRIVCVSRLVPHKRLDLLLQALPELRRAVPELTVDVVGDGPERERLETLTAELGLEETVTFHGRAPDEERDRLLGQAWLTVAPSSHEGWGLTVLEANARGVPAVAYRVAGLRDAIRHGETGWLADEGAPLAPIVLAALEHLDAPEAGRRFAQRCRAWAAGFSWDRTAERMAAVVLAEADRVARSHGERRRGSDLVTQASLTAAGSHADAVRGALRRTDVWRAAEDGTSVLLYGADEHDVAAALARAGVATAAEVAVARPVDLLLGGEPGGSRAPR